MAWEETIEDAILAAEKLRADPRIDEDRVFIIGVSLGGALAPRIHASGGNFAGLVLMAASPRWFAELIIEQLAAYFRSSYEDDVIDAELMNMMLLKNEALASEFYAISLKTAEEARAAIIPGWHNWAYYYWDLMMNPFADYASAANVPIFVLQGANDFQVLADVDFVLLKEIFYDRDDVTFRLYDGLNHAFIASTATNKRRHSIEIQEGGPPDTVDTRVLQDIVDWIHDN